jgi:hypothetical protein
VAVWGRARKRSLGEQTRRGDECSHDDGSQPTERYLGVVAPDGDAPRPDDEALPARSEDNFDEHLGQATASDPDPDAEIEDGFDQDAFGTDGFDDDSPDDGEHSALPSKVEAWRKRSATGAILTGFALGLQQVFEKEREQPAIVMTTSGDPPRDLPVEAEFEHGRPRQSVVSIRPWLLGNQAKPAAAGAHSAGVEPSEPETSDADAEDAETGSEDA